MQETETDNQNELRLLYKGDAYIQLSRLAEYLNIPPDQLSQVVAKGIKLLELARQNNSVNIILETNEQKQSINLKDI